MGTPHNAADKGQIAKTVLMPGDPLRAKMIAETFLENVQEFNSVRGMLGYTGTYGGKEISVMGSGMGMPSIGIYSYELFTEYDVDNIIRVGSAGAYVSDLKLYDVVLAQSAWTESSYAYTMSGVDIDTAYPSDELNNKLEKSAAVQSSAIHKGPIHSCDVFYRQSWQGEKYWEGIAAEHGCLAVEMESFALFHNAKVTGKKAACLLTISDNLSTMEMTTAEQRQKSFTNMMKIALGVL